MVANLIERLEKARKEADDWKAQALEAQHEAEQKRVPSDELVRRSAMLLQAEASEYGKECNNHVQAQRTGRLSVETIDTVREWNHCVPSLMKAFVEELCVRKAPQAMRATQDSEVARASRKCLVTGVLVYFASGFPFKDANCIGTFLKENGATRQVVDWMSKNLGVTSTDNNMWRLFRRMASECANPNTLAKAVPKEDTLAAVSFDNINMNANRKFRASEFVNLVGSIAYFFTDERRRKALSEAPPPQIALEFEEHFGFDGVRRKWDTFRQQVSDTSKYIFLAVAGAGHEEGT